MSIFNEIQKYTPPPKVPVKKIGGRLIETIHGYEGEGGTVGWCPHCDGRGKTGPTPDSAVPCDDCGGNGKWKFPPCNVAMAELRDKFGHLFSIKDES